MKVKPKLKNIQIFFRNIFVIGIIILVKLSSWSNNLKTSLIHIGPPDRVRQKNKWIARIQHQNLNKDANVYQGRRILC